MAAVLCAAVLMAASCRRQPIAVSPPQPVSTPAAEPAVDVRTVFRALNDQEAAAYAGDRACEPCHPRECRAAANTRHTQTLLPVTEAVHGPVFRSADRVKDGALGCTYSVQVRNGQCVMLGATSTGEKALAADFVFGSGKNAHTFMSRISDDEWIDLRISYYTGQKRWDFTPMQKPGDRELTLKAGIEQKGARLVSCVLCHATVVRASGDGLDAGKSDLGVRCERCHGPAKSHVDSARTKPVGGKAAIVHLEDLKRAAPDRINEVCGFCHKTPENAHAGDPKTENGLARFQGAALARSACFQQSGKLSCITCHDPHTDVDSNSSRNDAKCKSCHTTAAHTANTAAPHLCPVNKEAGCVKCHMPAQTIKSIPYAVYHNHWIKVWRGPIS